MFEKLKNALRKPAKIFTLMTGVALAPLARSGQADIDEALRELESESILVEDVQVENELPLTQNHFYLGTNTSYSQEFEGMGDLFDDPEWKSKPSFLKIENQEGIQQDLVDLLKGLEEIDGQIPLDSGDNPETTNNNVRPVDEKPVEHSTNNVEEVSEQSKAEEVVEHLNEDEQKVPVIVSENEPKQVTADSELPISQEVPVSETADSVNETNTTESVVSSVIPELKSVQQPQQVEPSVSQRKDRIGVREILMGLGALGLLFYIGLCVDDELKRKKEKRELRKKEHHSDTLSSVLNVGMGLKIKPKDTTKQENLENKVVAPISDDHQVSTQTEVKQVPLDELKQEGDVEAIGSHKEEVSDEKVTPTLTTDESKDEEKVVEEVVKSDEKMDAKNETSSPVLKPVVSLKDAYDERCSYLKGVRLLANIKGKRAALTRQKKALILEREGASAERQIEIDHMLDEIYAQRKELSLLKRQADVLIKGKEGEKIKEQRRLYTKQMTQLRRLMKKDGLAHTEEMNQINLARLGLKEQEKKLMLKAKEEMQERAEKSNWVHGVRALTEAKSRQNILNQQISELKKETGAKKLEILKENYELWQEQRQINQAKREALHLVKGHSFASRKSALSKQLKKALSEGNIALAEEISQEFLRVKEEEKACLESAKRLDYNQQRINLINGATSQRISKRREAERVKKERLETARFLRGQRMLYHLKKGLSTSVNVNQISPEDYRQEALALVGTKNQEFDYAKQRCQYLSDKALAGIYRRQKERS